MPKVRVIGSQSMDEDLRKKPLHTDEELYRADDIKAFIENERRHDQLERLNEVKMQRVLWWKTIIVSGLFNLLLIGMALYGMFFR